MARRPPENEYGKRLQTDEGLLEGARGNDGGMRRFRRSPRLFVPREEWRGDVVPVRGEDMRYLIRVLRLGAGDGVTVLDGQGRVFSAVINNVTNEAVFLALAEEITPDTEPGVRVALFQAVPKGDKMDLVVQKATELGAYRIVPVITERVVARPDVKKAVRRRDRWQRIAREASRQCGRSMVPAVETMLSLQAALELHHSTSFLGIMPWEGEEELSLRGFLEGILCAPTSERGNGISVFIGPEGGFSLSEVDAARACGVVTVSLGKRILRTETAGMITLALILHAFGELG
ncbi:MAG: 16S rRNA (uracil(1498)-N(3))-methyltransferase [Bacillota bacterium]